VELVNMRVSVWGPSPSLRPRVEGRRAPVADVRPIVFDAEPVAASVLRGELAPGTRVSGPALCALPEATLLVWPGWSGEVDEQGTIHLIATNAMTTHASSV
jgi:N-methylhydantoinase A